MPSTYINNLKIEEIATGEQSGVWGQTTNKNLGTLLVQSIAGYVDVTIVDNNVSPTTLDIPDGYVAGAGVARNMYLRLVGTTTALRYLILPTNSGQAKKLYFINNATTGGFSVTVKTAAGTGITVPNGSKMILVCDGTDILDATSSVYGSSGTANYVAKFSAYNQIVNTIIYDDGTNVGIGTAVPSYRLSINDSGTGLGFTNAASGNFNIGLLAGVASKDAYVYNRANANLIFGTNNINRMYIDTSGNLLVAATTNPSSSRIVSDGAGMVSVNSTCETKLFSNSTSGFVGTASSHTVNFGANGGSHLTILTSGNVGIGTTPSYKLDVSGKINTTNGILPRIYTTTTQASPWAWNSDTYDQLCITGLSNNLTINADAGTPTDGQKVIFRIKDNGTARTLTWTTSGSKSFRAIGLTLPTLTVASVVLYVGCIYNSADSYWDVVAVSVPA